MNNQIPMFTPEEQDPADTLDISSSPEEFNEMAWCIAYNKPIIQSWLDNCGPQEALTITGWLIGLFDVQKPELILAFDEARRVGRDLAKVLLDAFKREGGADALASGDTLAVLYPPQLPMGEPEVGIASEPVSKLVM